MRIRPAQVDAFEHENFLRFSARTEESLRSWAPDLTERLGPEAVRQTIKMGVDRAAKYNWTSSGAVQWFIELTLLFGVDFDTDPQFPWAKDILLNSFESDQLLRADELHDRYREFCDCVIGPESSFAHAALQRLSTFQATDGKEENSRTWRIHVRRRLESLYPERVQFAGGDATRRTIWRLKGSAEKIGIASPELKEVYVIAGFLAGHGFMNDPLYSEMRGAWTKGSAAALATLQASLTRNLEI